MKKVTKLLCLVLTLAMLFTIAPLSVFAANDAKNTFTDVDNSILKQYIIYWANQKSVEGDEYVVGGYQDGTFRPSNPIIRAEIAVILNRVYGFEGTGATADFDDVPETYWAYDQIMDCADNNVINGYGDGTFKPRNYSTRQAAIAMIARCIMTEENFAEFADTAAAKAFLAENFKDANKIPVSMYAEFCFLTKYGNLEGYPDGTVRPNQNITRAQFVKLLYAITHTDDKIYKLNITIADNKNNSVSDSTEYLTSDTNVLATLVPLIVADREQFKVAFPSPDMAAILDEGVAIAKAGIASDWAEADQTAWKTFVDTYAEDIGGAESAKALFSNVNSTIGDMTAGSEYVMTFDDTYEGRTDITYTVTISIEVM